MKGRLSTLHRIIADASEKQSVDHVDGNGLNDQRENLRCCEHHQNLSNRGKNLNNTSGFKGVHLNKNRWVAAIWSENKIYYLGRFKTKEEAAIIYNKKATELHGEFAKLNKI